MEQGFNVIAKLDCPGCPFIIRHGYPRYDEQLSPPIDGRTLWYCTSMETQMNLTVYPSLCNNGQRRFRIQMAQLLNIPRQVQQFSSTTRPCYPPDSPRYQELYSGQALTIPPPRFWGIPKSKLASAQNQFDLLYPPGHDGYM